MYWRGEQERQNKQAVHITEHFGVVFFSFPINHLRGLHMKIFGFVIQFNFNFISSGQMQFKNDKNYLITF